MVPQTAPTETADKPTAREILVPQMILEKRSRPNSSVPNQWAPLGPWRIAL